MKKAYYGGWSTNNGSSYGYGYKGKNYRELARIVKEAAKANTFKGNTGKWIIQNESGDIILEGTVKN